MKASIHFCAFANAYDNRGVITMIGVDGKGSILLLSATNGRPDEATVRRTVRPYVKAARLLGITVTGATGGL